MRNNVIMFLISLCIVALSVFAGDLTPNGMYQGDLYTFLSRSVTISNEVKADHNTLAAHVASLSLLANALKTSVEGATATVTVAAVATSGAAIPSVSAADLSLTGL